MSIEIGEFYAILELQPKDSAPLSRKLNKYPEVWTLKHYKDFLIIGIDHGYGNIKTANTVTPTGITRLDGTPTFTKNTLFFKDSYCQMMQILLQIILIQEIIICQLEFLACRRAFACITLFMAYGLHGRTGYTFGTPLGTP